MKFEKAVVVTRGYGNSESERAIDVVSETLHRYGMPFESYTKDTLPEDALSGECLAIALGGDNTCISTARMITDSNTVFWGVRDKKKSMGGNTTADAEEFPEKLALVLDGKAGIGDATRIYASLLTVGNGYKGGVKTIGPVINDVVFGCMRPDKGSKYTLRLPDGREDSQCCCGLVVSTGSGSTGLYRSSGGEPFSRFHPGFRFRSIIPAWGEILSGELTGEDVLEVESDTVGYGIVGIEGLEKEAYSFLKREHREGLLRDIVRIGISDSPLRIVHFD